MSWILASLIAAVFLGLYDLCNKHAVRENAVLPVIFFGTLVSAVIWGSLLALQRCGSTLPPALTVDPLDGAGHLRVLLKTGIVSASWVFTYFAFKHLPVSLAGPIRATGPLWTLLGAILAYGERPRALQALGIATTLGGFFLLSLAGRAEGIRFRRNPWVACLLAGTLLGGVSTLWDKHLFGTIGMRAPTVQCWFSIYLAFFFLPLAWGWLRRWWPRGEFRWRWSILGIGPFLLASDYLYFSALRDPASLLAVVATIRRGSVLVSFAGGIWLYKEGNLARKLAALAAVLAGIVLIVAG